MRKLGLRNWQTFAVILAGALALAACGGGGSSGGGNGPAGSYTGNTQAAVINAETAEEIALGAYEGGELQFGMGILPTGASMSSLAVAETLSASLNTQNLAQTSSVSTAMQTETIPGDCGGSMTQSISSNAAGTSFSGNMTFKDYCSADLTIDGGVSFSGTYNEQANTIDLKLNFNSLTSSMDGESVTSRGSMTMDNISLDMGSGPETFSVNMVMTDPATGDSYWLKDYTMTVSPASNQVEISGRYYHYDYGYVDISTVQAIQLSGVDGYPQSGSVRFDGSDGTWATLTFTGSGGYLVAASDGTSVQGLL